MNKPKLITYRCTGMDHIDYLRLTTLKPDPMRWQGQACGHCLRLGITDSVLKADIK